MLNKDEVKRYLGYRDHKLDENTFNMIEECEKELSEISASLGIYEVYELDGSDKIPNTNIALLGDDIKNHLDGSKKVAVMAATLGPRVDALIYKYNKINLSKAIVLDACASTLIEKVCDELSDEILSVAKKERLKVTPRFSPGYGDFPIEVQGSIIKLLRADKLIGLTATNESVLIPTKSVTAFIGFTDKQEASCNNKCVLCKNSANCKFRKG